MGVAPWIRRKDLVELAPGPRRIVLEVANRGDRPIQVGSLWPFDQADPALYFDRAAAHGMRLDIPRGARVCFAPGAVRFARLVAVAA